MYHAIFTISSESLALAPKWGNVTGITLLGRWLTISVAFLRGADAAGNRDMRPIFTLVGLSLARLAPLLAQRAQRRNNSTAKTSWRECFNDSASYNTATL
jgi:hypothetical protein